MSMATPWFDEGARFLRPAVERLGRADELPEGDVYLCPCCLLIISRDRLEAEPKILSIEHVPPRSLGGTGLVLTCTRCNNRSGDRFDNHAVDREHAYDFLRGRVTGHQLRATVYADGIPLKATVRLTDSGMQVFGVPKQNDPRRQAAHFEALDAMVERRDPQPEMSLSVHMRFDEARARISWIRSAYLATFAALGWGYILRSIMQPIRDQLASPDERILPTYMGRLDSASSSERRILIVQEPHELRCIAVVFGEHLVLLPGYFDPLTWDEVAQAYAQRRDSNDRFQIEFHGKEVPWPTRAMYGFDSPPA